MCFSMWVRRIAIVSHLELGRQVLTSKDYFWARQELRISCRWLCGLLWGNFGTQRILGSDGNDRTTCRSWRRQIWKPSVEVRLAKLSPSLGRGSDVDSRL